MQSTFCSHPKTSPVFTVLLLEPFLEPLIHMNSVFLIFLLVSLHKGSTELLRSQYFSNITCAQLLKLEHVYQMDLDLYDYNIDPFKLFCKNRSGVNPEPPGLWDKLPMIKSEVLKVVGLPGW